MFVWIDCEMTGLNVYQDKIIEIAVILTDDNLENLIIGPELIIHQSKNIMMNMNEWCIEHHGNSGLTQKVLDSKLSTKEAESIIFSFIKKHIPEPNIALLAGNSVHMDKEFLRKEMPNVLEHLNYRLIDVSTIKECFKRWHVVPTIALPLKKCSHRALDDIKESIEELRYYRTFLVNKN